MHEFNSFGTLEDGTPEIRGRLFQYQLGARTMTLLEPDLLHTTRNLATIGRAVLDSIEDVDFL